MALRSPTSFHSYWGAYPTVSLPTSSDVQVGDTAYDSSIGLLVVCTSIGPVVWSAAPGQSIYGSFTGNNTQAIPIGGVVVASLDTVEASNGVTNTASSVVVPFAGVYLFNFSAQLNASGNATVSMWLVKNGNNEPRTNSELELSGSSRRQLPFVEFMLSLGAGDAIEVAFSTTAACNIQSFPNQITPDRPSTPAIIVNCHKIG